ncbi:hypothetical protein [Dyadobacter sp.]|uniref:hypothetical protein n=1 Tax=Dyadobacter sp. TaxID=1914288 RepID=UPI003F7130EF
MGFTLEQFKQWVGENFPDNTSRAIAENDFRDGLNAMADFVFETNSSAFVEASMAEMNGLLDQAQNTGAGFETIRMQTASLLSQTSNERALAQQAHNNSQLLLGQFQQLIAQGFTPKDNYTIATNTPNLNTVPKAQGDAYVVDADGTSTITGKSLDMKKGDVLHWNAANSLWVWRPNATQPSDGSVTRQKLESWLSDLFTPIDPDSQYLDVRTDSQGRIGLSVRKSDGGVEGNFIIEKQNMQPNSVGPDQLENSSITLDKLAQAVSERLFQPWDNSGSRYAWPFLDQEGRMPFAVTKDGKLEADLEIIDGTIAGIKLLNDTIEESKLSPALRGRIPTPAFTRINASNLNDVTYQVDDLWRAVEINIETRTNAQGYIFASFPPKQTPVLKGLNDTGFDLMFKETLRIPIRGRSNRGNFNPASNGVFGWNYRGNYGNGPDNTYGALPAGAIGDCWVIDGGNQIGTRTANGLTFKNGDCLVKIGVGTANTDYAIQSGPGDGTFLFNEGQFWTVTNSGYFAGKYYAVGSRIYVQGRQTAGGPYWVKYGVSKPGELYIMGECDGTFAPVSPKDGDAYIFSANAIAAGITGAIGDMIAYRSGWGLIQSKKVTVPAGQWFYLPCQNAAEWSVRRVDKSNTIVAVKGLGHSMSVRRKTTDEIRLWSDSMFGGGSVGAKINSLLAAQGRVSSLGGYGGSTSEDILSMIRDSITAGDPHVGKVQVLWHGQNNLSFPRIVSAAYQFTELVGAEQARFIFWSVLGVRYTSWNAGLNRFVAQTQEDAFNKTGVVYEVEQFYEKAFPRQWFSPRKALLEAAATKTRLDPTFPGKTEAQVAALYGVLPFSYWFEWEGKPFKDANLNYVGNWDLTQGMPTGGNNLDYYLRLAAGDSGGNLIVNVGGVWTEYSFDKVHISQEAGTDLSAKFLTFFNTLNI